MSVLVYCETVAGDLRKASLEAMSVGQSLAGDVNAVAVGGDVSAAVNGAKAHGGAKVFALESADHADYVPETHVSAILAAAEQCGATIVLIPATTRGRDLAPRVAVRINAGLLEDVTGLEMDGDTVKVSRPEYAGKVYRTMKATSLPVVVTPRPNTFDLAPADGAAERVDLSVDAAPRAKVVETRKAGGEKLDVAEADRVVGGGRGMKDPEHFKLLDELADTLGAAVAASRAVVDAGWRPHSEQVGQTGKVVSPTLYIAVGISGAVQHLAGMQTSKTIVAINKDKDAPIFKIADYGLVGDALEVVPALNAELKK